MELANLTGYRLRPGVAASVYLAYTLEDRFEDEAKIPAGSAVQSVPGPDEQSQTFETAEALTARADWNNLQPRLARPQTEASIFAKSNEDGVEGYARVYLKGINTNLKKNDAILVQFGTDTPTYQRVHDVIPDPTADKTLVRFTSPPEPAVKQLVNSGDLVAALTLRRSLQPRNSSRLSRAIHREFARDAQAGYTALKSFAPQVSRTLAHAAGNAVVSGSSQIKVYALRREASVFGHNTAKRTKILEDGEVVLAGENGNWPVFKGIFHVVNAPSSAASSVQAEYYEEEGAIHLDAVYDGILPDSWMVIRTLDGTLTDHSTLVVQARNVDHGMTRSEYGMTGPTSRIELPDGQKWISYTNPDGSHKAPVVARDFDAVRTTRVFAESELLELADEPVDTPICSFGGNELEIELDGFYDGLESGRWVIVSGEREIEGTRGVMASELAMLASVEHRAGTGLPGDSLHTVIGFAKPLEYCFKRDSVRIYGNVVKATHGETQDEILGNGDARQAFQAFDLKQAPLTFISDPNPSGVDSSLTLRVNEVRWQEVDSLSNLGPDARKFITRTDEDGKVGVVFGDGSRGSRVPTGTANVRVQYRYGIGQPGNVRAEQISLLKSKPLGVKEVINPLSASGGADREHRDQARRNVPLALKALDRLVSVQDYEDFARVYAGVGKAVATELSDGRRQVVHVTIAGTDDIPIDETSDLFRNLQRALYAFGDTCLAIRLAVRERLMMVLQARVRIHPDYTWESVSGQLRATLLEAFGFANRELGEDVYLSEVLSVMQRVPGVIYVDADAFGGVPEKTETAVVDKITGETRFERRYLPPDEINDRASFLLKGHTGMTGDFDRTGSRRHVEVIAVGQPGPNQRLPVNLAGRAEGETLIHPAQIAFFAPEVPATLVLNEMDRGKHD